VTASYGAVVPTGWDAAVFVAAPRPQVFEYLADPRNRPQWQATLDRVELLDEGEPRVGQRWVDHLKGGPAFELQIIGMEAPDLWAEMGSVGPLRAFVTLLFQDETRDGVPGTCVRVVARVRGDRFARPLGWVATAAMTLLVRVDLPRLVRAVERRS
jgi:uncharacterized protein YndB with AHSA1/START domain